jgi:hypothetical protein
MLTVDPKTTSNIPIERYCLGYVINHHNRHAGCHRVVSRMSKLKTEKRSKMPYSLYVLGIPVAVKNVQ